MRGEKDTAVTEQRLKIDGVASTPLVLSDLTASWAGGELPETKEITVRLKEGMEVKDLAVENPLINPHFIVESIAQPNGGLIIRITPNSINADKVSLNDGHEIQQPYLLTYKYSTQGIVKRERFYTLIYRP